MRDPYSVLGVPKSATEQDIKRAFRKLAKQYHPDQNANNPEAQSRFSEINQAYEIIGDKDKRQKFDRGEIDAEGKPKFQAHGFEGFSDFDPFRDAGATRGFRASGGPAGGASGGGGFDDILNDILGGFGARRGGGPSGSAGAGAGRSSMPQASAHFPHSRFPGLDEHFRRLGSVTLALHEYGVTDYRRASTVISSRMPTVQEARILRQSKTKPVLVTHGINVDPRDWPIEYCETRFAAERVQLVVET